eukprot:6172424-Pleurochrysis_carterae.AAC.2
MSAHDTPAQVCATRVPRASAALRRSQHQGPGSAATTHADSRRCMHYSDHPLAVENNLRLQQSR